MLFNIASEYGQDDFRIMQLSVQTPYEIEATAPENLPGRAPVLVPMASSADTGC